MEKVKGSGKEENMEKNGGDTVEPQKTGELERKRKAEKQRSRR